MSIQADDLLKAKNEGYDPHAHEEEPKNLSVGISIRNLTKIYDEVAYIDTCTYLSCTVHTYCLYVCIYV